jgi:hypothetical protein
MDHASGELSCHGITLHLVSNCRAEKQTDQGSLNVEHFKTMVVPDPPRAVSVFNHDGMKAKDQQVSFYRIACSLGVAK